MSDNVKSIKNETPFEKLKRQAKEEVNEAVVSKARTKLVTKYKERAAAEKIVNNITREIEDLELEIEHDLQ